MSTEPHKIRPIEWVVGAAVAIAALLALAILAADFWPWRKVLNHQGLAAWVQAIGSLIALAVAVYVPARQHRLQQQAQKSTEQRAAYIAIEEVSALILFASNAVGRARALAPPAGAVLSAAAAQRIMSELNSIQLPSTSTLHLVATADLEAVKWCLRASA